MLCAYKLLPMDAPDLTSLRKDYRLGHLLEAETPADPIELFNEWMRQALDAKADEPTAMALATAQDGRPSCRIVLLKGVVDGAFRFYTNYKSRKGHELSENPQAAATIFWPRLERQVRIEGAVRRLSRETSAAYFNSRPLESRISAAVSPQSQVVEGRAALEFLWKEKEATLHGQPPTLPDDWGGYEIQPDYIEFWQGGSGRLHDRIVYARMEDAWAKSRLAP